MARNSELVNAVSAYLLGNADRQVGKTQQEIADHFGVDRTTITRMFKRHPEFKRSLRPQFPYAYWFDVTAKGGAKSETGPTGNSGEANPLLAANPAVVKGEIERLAKTLLKLAKGEQLEQEKLPLVIRALRLTADYLEVKNGK